jgi:hypothetical protein
MLRMQNCAENLLQHRINYDVNPNTVSLMETVFEKRRSRCGSVTVPDLRTIQERNVSS